MSSCTEVAGVVESASSSGDDRSVVSADGREFASAPVADGVSRDTFSSCTEVAGVVESASSSGDDGSVVPADGREFAFGAVVFVVVEVADAVDSSGKSEVAASGARSDNAGDSSSKADAAAAISE